MTQAQVSREGSHIDIVLDGPPSHESGRFVEVENADGKSIKFGEWIHRDDGYWALRIAAPSPPARGEIDRSSPLFPRRWILYWHGSGPKRGTHIMELTGYDMSYAREIAYLGDDGSEQQLHQRHNIAENIVIEHNLVVERLRALSPLPARPAHAGETARQVLIDREELRRLVIQQHVRMAEGGGDVPNGQSCIICKGEWGHGASEFHAETCPLAAVPAPASAEDLSFHLFPELWKASQNTIRGLLIRLNEMSSGSLLELSGMERDVLRHGLTTALAAAPAAPPLHTDRSMPCPTCGFVIRETKRKPFVIEDDGAPPPSDIDALARAREVIDNEISYFEKAFGQYMGMSGNFVAERFRKILAALDAKPHPAIAERSGENER